MAMFNRFHRMPLTILPDPIALAAPVRKEKPGFSAPVAGKGAVGRGDGVFQLRRDPAHLVGDARGVEGGPDDSGRDQQDQLGLLDLLLDGAEEQTQDRNAVEEGNAGSVERALVLDQSAEDQRLIVQQHHGGLGLSLREAGRVDRRRLRGADFVDFLLDVQRDGAVLADSRRDSTVWVMALPVMPPVATGTCCDVTMGTDVETLITAFLFSEVMTEGFESTLTLFSLASAFIAARNLSAAKVKTLRPSGTAPPRGMRLRVGCPGSVPVGEPLMSKRPLRIAHSRPSLVSSVKVTSAASTT